MADAGRQDTRDIDDARTEYRTSRSRDSEPAAPASQPAAPPSQTSRPAPTTSSETVTPDSVARQAEQAVPSASEVAAFANWRKKELAPTVETILALSGLDIRDFGNTLSSWKANLDNITENLNKKQITTPEKSEPCPTLPGSCSDPTCQSLFDVNELAIRGRKAVSTTRIYLPVIFPELKFGARSKWMLGQKVEYEQEMRHEGYTLGSLISSFSMLPNEEVTIEVSSWQRTKSEILEEKDESKRQLLEQELKRTDEKAISDELLNQNGWTVAATTGFSVGPISASADAGVQGDSSERVSKVRRQVEEATVRATSDISTRRAIKMTLTTESATEQKTVRRMKNPNQCHTVTFNFFQVIKIIDLQMRFLDDSPVLYLPSLFPATYSDGKSVRIPYEYLESFTAPANVLMQYFDVDRDLSQEIHGFALRVRSDVGRDPAGGLRLVAEALVVAAKLLGKVDPKSLQGDIAAYLKNYAASAARLRLSALSTYGPGKGKSLQMNTPGIYVDSLMGRCSACEDVINAERYVAVKRAEAECDQLNASTDLLRAEGLRRQALLAKGELLPFESPDGEMS